MGRSKRSTKCFWKNTINTTALFGKSLNSWPAAHLTSTPCPAMPEGTSQECWQWQHHTALCSDNRQQSEQSNSGHSLHQAPLSHQSWQSYQQKLLTWKLSWRRQYRPFNGQVTPIHRNGTSTHSRLVGQGGRSLWFARLAFFPLPFPKIHFKSYRAGHGSGDKQTHPYLFPQISSFSPRRKPMLHFHLSLPG